jgi:hypothetical protein
MRRNCENWNGKNVSLRNNKAFRFKGQTDPALLSLIISEVKRDV